MDYLIAGKTALVLGASRGLGAAIAKALAAEGVKVFAAARNVAAMEKIDNITPLTVDLSDETSVAAMIATITAAGGVDILVNNSGGPKAGPAAGQSKESWASAFDSMATSIFTVTDAMLEGMIARKWGRIITIGSSGVVQPIPNLALSNGIRAAVSGWSKTLAGEVARHGITVNMILPGRIDTDRVRELDAGKAEKTAKTIEAVQEASRAEIPAGRYGKPEEFAAVAVFLASAQASYVTGSAIRVDGGMIKGF
ncbi:SDR family oxidoreductase [Agrobacterium rosae]|uniref:3-oxoacyl-ACP reductase n=1 Tax=Agrobacterium rosae TaxID=1972867 RepID=A0A1R3TMR1_9HYPH|nr:SDR family oxidoreductase [Agrobacterium rosae]KAA3515856.1 SDR family oxidoreductase [Agrobacterium rosae]KAA3524811.1 SDR family oxidoreductase [Agrobacterium rosae]MCM2431768.1 SDR family oxidoreductase [Agrobacterium rosae]MDX8312235.1 SDR family oxidoreductase [Agrobacterium rosae]MDX8328566.1 SDR family oxidoreductase [Agrobacterium rosae]